MGRARKFPSNAARQAHYRAAKAARLLQLCGTCVTIGPCTLHCGDALAVVPHLPPWDHVITDPAYEDEVHTRTRRTRAVLEGRDPYAAIPFAPITEAQRRFITRLRGGWILAFCQAEAVKLYADLFGTKYRRVCTWVKPDSAPQCTGDRPAQGAESIVCAWGAPGKSHWNAGGKRGVYTHSVHDGHPRLHPTQKPVPLLRELLRDFTQPDDVILDPFMGSGSLGVACFATGRRYVGVELDPSYFAKACTWIAQVQQQGRLFAAS